MSSTVKAQTALQVRDLCRRRGGKPHLPRALRHFADTVARVPEVSEVVLFQDAEGLHVWTIMSERAWDGETAVLRAHRALRSEYEGDELDLLILACPREDAEDRLPTGFVRLYSREQD